MPGSIERRIRAAENRMAAKPQAPVITYFFDRESGDAERERAEAVAGWEKINGPLGELEPDLLGFTWEQTP